jgi:hypothetical protein
MQALPVAKDPINPEVKAKLQAYLHDCKELDCLIQYFDLLPQTDREGLEYDVRLISHDTDDKAVKLWKLVEKVHFDNLHLFNSDGPMLAFQRDFPELYEKQLIDLAAKKCAEAKKKKAISFVLKSIGITGLLLTTFHLTSPIHGKYDDTIVLNNSSVPNDQTKPLFGELSDFGLVGYYRDGFRVDTRPSKQFKYIVVRVSLTDGLEPLELIIKSEEFETIFGRRSFVKVFPNNYPLETAKIIRVVR